MLSVGLPWMDDKPFIEKSARNAANWSVDEVCGFISKLGFSDQAQAFRREVRIS